ncbi:hypothetical protein [Neolewinella antarctica]|uniref:Uncharacterized protein n=1 Tax=Neolewinella antarctica TaxID=442734 RepID=A0ABX0XID1_9BACT|nr:hypothetical protein [Neolewinella antarctica]NJC28518.1 hypothetical protein [Neolewinella antarctica]
MKLKYNLSGELGRLETLATEKDVPFFAGVTKDHTSTVSVLIDSNLDRFIQLVARLNIDSICYASNILSVNDIAGQEHSGGKLEDSLERRRNNLIAKVGQITNFIAGCISNGIVYECFLEDLNLSLEVEEFNFDYDEYIIAHEMNSKHKITEKERNKIAEQVASDVRFLIYSTRYDKASNLVKEIIKENGFGEDQYLWEDSTDIYSMAQYEYGVKHKSSIEDELRATILSLASAGYSKKAITSKLDLTKGLLDKYYTYKLP